MIRKCSKGGGGELGHVCLSHLPHSLLVIAGCTIYMAVLVITSGHRTISG